MKYKATGFNPDFFHYEERHYGYKIENEKTEAILFENKETGELVEKFLNDYYAKCPCTNCKISSVDLAYHLLILLDEDAGETISTTKLYNIMFYIQLAFISDPLFEEDFIITQKGVYLPEVAEELTKRGLKTVTGYTILTDNITNIAGHKIDNEDSLRQHYKNVAKLDDNTHLIINNVFKEYYRETSRELSAMVLDLVEGHGKYGDKLSKSQMKDIMEKM